MRDDQWLYLVLFLIFVVGPGVLRLIARVLTRVSNIAKETAAAELEQKPPALELTIDETTGKWVVRPGSPGETGPTVRETGSAGDEEDFEWVDPAAPPLVDETEHVPPPLPSPRRPAGIRQVETARPSPGIRREPSGPAILRSTAMRGEIGSVSDEEIYGAHAGRTGRRARASRAVALRHVIAWSEILAPPVGLRDGHGRSAVDPATGR